LDIEISSAHIFQRLCLSQFLKGELILNTPYQPGKDAKIHKYILPYKMGSKLSYLIDQLWTIITGLLSFCLDSS